MDCTPRLVNHLIHLHKSGSSPIHLCKLGYCPIHLRTTGYHPIHSISLGTVQFTFTLFWTLDVVSGTAVLQCRELYSALCIFHFLLPVLLQFDLIVFTSSIIGFD